MLTFGEKAARLSTGITLLLLVVLFPNGDLIASNEDGSGIPSIASAFSLDSEDLSQEDETATEESATKEEKTQAPWWPLKASWEGIENFEVTGYLLLNYGVRLSGKIPGGKTGSFLLGEERLRLDLEKWFETPPISLRLKGDLFHDTLDGSGALDLREAYLDYTQGPFDIRTGRQIVTWGVGDLLFINDVFPKDWVSYFSGRHLEYLKSGVDAARLSYTSEPLSLDLVVIPRFQPDALPGHDRFTFYDPLPPFPRVEDLPDAALANTEIALRLHRQILGFDVAGYGYRGFWRTPSVRFDNPTQPTSFQVFYPRLYVLGASAQGNLLGGVVSLETGIYKSRDDRDGLDASIPNSTFKYLVGYQRQVLEDTTIGLQYYGEKMEDYWNYKFSLPPGFAEQNPYRDALTFRLTSLMRNQTLKMSLFGNVSLTDTDYLIQPELSYQFTDQITGTVGANIFGGKEDTSFLGQFDDNDNIYGSLRIGF